MMNLKLFGNLNIAFSHYLWYLRFLAIEQYRAYIHLLIQMTIISRSRFETNGKVSLKKFLGNLKPTLVKNRLYHLNESFDDISFLNQNFPLIWTDRTCYLHVNEAKVSFQTLVRMCCIKTYSKLLLDIEF